MKLQRSYLHLSDDSYHGSRGLLNFGGCKLSARKIKEIWRAVRRVARICPNEMDFCPTEEGCIPTLQPPLLCLCFILYCYKILYISY